tara:strand:- start:1801 stop:1989 length:189 start_codon:yes stop_codon:yes gene_type:complete
MKNENIILSLIDSFRFYCFDNFCELKKLSSIYLYLKKWIILKGLKKRASKIVNFVLIFNGSQ